MSVRAAAVDDRRRTAPQGQRPRDIPLGWEIRLGLLALAVLVALALYGPLLAPHDFNYARGLVDGKVPPYAPSDAFPIGSDEYGHDLLSWFLIGARTTLGIAAGAALLRLAIGGTLGAAAAWRGGTFESVATRLALALSSIPSTAVAILAVLAFDIRTGAPAALLGLGLVGWGDAFHHARRATRQVAAQPFIGAARALGLRDTRLLLRHVIPNVAPSLVVSAALQLSAVLITLGEIGLLRLFIGGGVTEEDSLGRRIVVPSQPDWTSMLAGTRPITTLYGAPWLVLVPGTALFAAVVGTSLLADGLARRALELDIFRLFSRRQLVALLVGAVLVVGPVLVWPSRLAAELTYADGFDAALAAQFARELQGPAFDGRAVGSVGARAAADLIVERTGGTALSIQSTVVAPRAARFAIGDRSLEIGAHLEPLSLMTGTATGPLVLVQPDGLRGQPAEPSNAPLRGAIAVLDRPSLRTFDLATHGLPLYGVTGIVVLGDDQDAYPTSVRGLTVPVAHIDRARFSALLGETPAPRGPITSLVHQAALEISVQTEDIAVNAVVVRVAGSRPSGPIIVMTASYDTAPYLHDPRGAWPSAAATGVLVAAAERVRRELLPAELLLIAMPGHGLGHFALAAALEQLPPEDRARIAAVVSVEGLAVRERALRAALADSSTPSSLRGARAVAPRVADALGVPVDALGASFERSLATFRNRAAYQVAPWTSESDEPSAGDYQYAGRMVLVLASYLARHVEELR